MNKQTMYAVQKFRALAAQLSVGWDPLEPDLVRFSYGEAFQEAARRINEVADEVSRDLHDQT